MTNKVANIPFHSRDFKVNNFKSANFHSFIRFLHGTVTQKLRIDSEFMDYGAGEVVLHFTFPRQHKQQRVG